MPRYYTREMMDMFNVSRKQLRYYEDKGLLRNVPRNEDNGYRYYTIEHVKQMIAIMGMKDLNLPSDKIKDILYADSISDVKEVMQHKLDDAKKDVAFSMGQYIKVMEMYNRIMEGILYNSSPEYQSDVNGNLGMYEVVTVPPRDVISMSYMETFQDPDSIFIKQLAEIQSLSKAVDVYNMLNATFIFYDHFDVETNTFDGKEHLSKVTMRVQNKNKPSNNYEHIKGFRGISTFHRGFPTDGLEATYHDLIEWGKSQGYNLKNISYEEWNLSLSISNSEDGWLMRIIIPIDE